MKMRLALLWILSALFIVSCADASTTAVTATITDPNGQVFANGTFKAEWYGDAQAVVTGVGDFNKGPISGTLDASGTFTVTLTDDHSVAPAGGKWRFTVCPNASTPCSSSIQDVTGATLNLSTQISADVNAIGITGTLLPKAYSATQVANPKQGTMYFDTTLSLPQFFNGAAWINGIASSVTQVNGVNTTSQSTTDFRATAPLGVTNPSGGIVNYSLSQPFPSYFDVTEIAPPVNPAVGNQRFYSSSATHQMNCITSTGASCFPSTGGGALNGNNTWTGTNTFTGTVGASLINGVRAISQFVFTQFPVTPSSIAAGANTVTLAVGPMGLNAATDVNHFVEVAGTGTPEAVVLTGGTCTPFVLNCTIVFTAAGTHAAGYSISSATAGCQEAYQDAPSGGSLFVEPAIAHAFNATCSLNSTTKAITVRGDGVSSRISGDPGNAALLALNNGVTCTSPIRVTNLRIGNQHSTVTDTAEHAITVTSTCNFEIDNITYDAGKVGLFITSLGGGGQTQDGRIHDSDCWGPNFFGSLMDGCVWVNGDNVSLPTVRMSMWNMWSHNLATTGHSGPPVDMSCEDCIQSYGHHLYVYDDAGFTEAGAGAFQFQANHDTGINDDWFSDLWAFKTGGANGIALRMNANKIYTRVGVYNFHFDGYKNGINVGQGYTADNQLNNVVIGPGELTNIDNSGAYGIIATGTGANFRADLTIRGVKIRGTGAGTSLIGVRCNLLDGLKLENNDVQFVATHGFDFEGCSNGTLTGNISNNNGQTVTTGNGFNFTANTSIGSSFWNLNGNTASDTQAVHTQNYGFVNNSATDGPSCLGGSNVAGNNVNDQFRDTPGKWIKGGNCSFGGTNSGAETMLVSTQKSGTSANTDANGTLTMAAGTATYTFTGTYTSHPNCSASDETAIAAVKVTYTGATSVTFTTAGATDVIDYACSFRN